MRNTDNTDGANAALFSGQRRGPNITTITKSVGINATVHMYFHAEWCRAEHEKYQYLHGYSQK